jgi:hypothetical protein
MVSLPVALPQRFAGLGVLLLGLSWSAGIFLARQDVVAASGVPPAQAFGYIAVGGVGAVAASWFGVGAVLFAMTRLLRARAPFWSVLWALAGALPPLWIAAPAAALIQAGDGRFALAAVVAVAAAAFLMLATRAVAEVAALSPARAAGCLVLTAIFSASVAVLS